MSGRIVKLQNKNVLNPFDPSGDTELNLFPVSVIKGIYDEDNLRLDRALQKIAVYNVSLGDVKSGTTTQYDTISNAIEAVYLEATNKSTLAKINPGSLISFLDKDNKYELWQYNSALTDETSIKNTDNWVKLESSGDLSNIVKRIVALEADNTTNKANITTLFSTCASLSQAITDIKVDIANLKTECQKLEDSKVDKYSTSHYYNITSSKYSYTLQRIVSVPDNDSIYGTIEMSFSGRSGYSIYNDLLFMNTNESQKVISLVTDLFYTITEMIDSKQYVTLCAINQYNPRNPFQFNIDISKYSSAYNKTIEITGDNRPDKSFIWYDDTNSTNRNLNLSDVTSAIAAEDYTKYLSYKKGLVIKSSFATSDLNPVDACTLTITSADDTNGYKGADFVQYKDFIVKWDISSNGGLSKIKLLSHTTTSTDELGNTTSSTSYYDTSKIYRISPTKTMSNFILVGPADATNTASNDNVVLIDYESIIPAGSIITLTPPASSTETWLIDVKTPDIYAKENSIVVSQDTEGKSAIGRDVRKTTFKTSYDTFDKLETYLNTRLTDSWKYIPIIKIPFDGKSLHCHFGLSMSIAFTSMDPQFSGDLFLNVNKSDFYSETYSSYIRFNFIGHINKTHISSTLADDVIANIAVMFADKDDNFLTTSNNITSDVKYAYICLLGFSYDSTTGILSNYITEGSISLYDVPDGTITANESTESTDLMYGIKGLKSLTYINQFPMYASCFCSDYYINKILTQCNNLETSKQDKLTFDVTPTDGSTNPVTSDGISAVLKKKCSIVSEITVAEQTNLSNPVDRGIYIIKKIDSTSTTPEYGSVDSFGGSCLLPHLAIYYKDSDGVFKHAHLPIGEIKSYTSITISSNILTLTKNDGSVETITLPSVDSKGNDIESTYATKTELSNHTSNVSNPHKVTKDQVGLGNVDNTADIDKPISTATQTALDTKQVKGDYALNSSLDNYVLKEDGKGLSTNDYTNDEKTKLASISSGAEVNVQSDWSTTDTSADSYILNKPTALSSFTNDKGYDTVTSVNSKLSNHTANVSNPHGVSYTQLKGKISYDGTGTTWRKIILSFTTPALANSSVRFHFTYYANNQNSYNSRGDILLSILLTSSTTWVANLSVTNWYGDIPNFYMIDNGSGSFQFAISNDYLNPWIGFDIYLKHMGGKISTYSYGDQGLTTSGSLMSKSIGTAYTVGALTITKNGTSVGTFNGSANTTIALTDTTYSDATTTTHGLMTATDKVKLNGITSDGSNYSGNAASATKLATARSITLSGNTTGTATFDGSANLTIATTTSYAMSASLDASGHDIVSTYATKTELNNHVTDLSNPHKVTKSQVGLCNVDNTSDVYKVVKGVFANESTVDDYGHVWFSNIALDTTRMYDDAFEYNPHTDTLKVGTVIGSITGNAATSTKLATARTITLTGDTTGTATFDGSDNVTIATSTNYAPSSIQPFDYLDSDGGGTFWAQTSTNSIAVPFMTDSKVTTNKVRIFLESAEGAKIRCAIYKKESSVLSLVVQTQLYIGQLDRLVGIPFETVATLDSDALYYFVFECSSSDSTFVGKQISASLMIDFVYKGDAFNANSDTFKSQYPTDGIVDGNVFIPYFKII